MFSNCHICHILIVSLHAFLGLPLPRLTHLIFRLAPPNRCICRTPLHMFIPSYSWLHHILVYESHSLFFLICSFVIFSFLVCPYIHLKFSSPPLPFFIHAHNLTAQHTDLYTLQGQATSSLLVIVKVLSSKDDCISSIQLYYNYSLTTPRLRIGNPYSQGDHIRSQPI